MAGRFRVDEDQAVEPFALGIDIGSGGTRAALYDASGREVGKRRSRVEHVFTSGADGTSVIDADLVAEEVERAIVEAVGDFARPIAAVGFDTFASSLVPVDAAGRAVGPCITYADTRCRGQVARLLETVDVDALHDVTGSRSIHTSYMTPRLVWLREEQPDVFRRAARFMALGEYVALRLVGEAALGTAAAAWGGMLDRRTGEYVPALLEVAGVGAEALGRPRDPSDTVPVAGTPLAARVPVLQGAVWVPVVGDGLTANMGMGALGVGTWGISTATSGAIRMLLDGPVDNLPGGLWAYRVDRRRTLFGSAMSDCGRVLDFAMATFRLPGTLADLDSWTILGADPTPSTPLVVPFLSGERGTKWRGGLRALFAGVGAATTPEDLLRGSMEGVALSFLRIADQLRDAGGPPERIVLSGGMTNALPAWLQILADALDHPIDHIAIPRSTMRGSALLALEQTDADDLADIPVLRSVEPVPGRAAHYRQRLARFEELADHA